MINKYRTMDLNYKMFRELLLKKKHYNCSLLCGSFSELPIMFVLNNITDIDAMYSIRNIVALQNCDDSRKFKNLKILRIDTSNCHIGFAKILDGPDIGLTVLYKRPQEPNTSPYSGPSMTSIKNFREEWNALHHFFAYFDQKWASQSEVKVDFVYALRCPSWPIVANEWKTRQREYGWPSVDVIDKIINSGCRLVSKPHPSNLTDDTQWRFSFSQAELILIQHWTHVQKYIYHILRLIKSEIVKECGGENETILCTYFLKTLMLWSCEEKTQEFWREGNIETAVGELLCIMIEWLIEKRVPNYFIPEYNMIDYLRNDDSLDKEIFLLLNLREKYLFEFLELNAFVNSKPTLHLEVPNKLLEVILLMIGKWSMAKTSEWTHLENCLRVSDNFLSELSCLFQAVQIQLSLMTCQTVNYDKVRNVLKLFNLAKKADEGVSQTVLPLGVSVSEYMQHICKQIHESEFIFKLRIPATRGVFQNTVTNLEYFNKVVKCHGEYCQSKKCLRCCDIGKGEQDSPILKSQLANGLSLSDLRMTGAEAKLQKLQIILQPFLKNLTHDWRSPSFFMAAAYQANFFYTCLRDYTSAIEQCQEAWRYLDLLREKFKQTNTVMMHNLFHVILVSDWSVMFDDHLQVLLGFLTLAHRSRCATQNRSRNCTRIVVHLFPMEFLRYVRFQSVRKLRGNETVTYECDFQDAVRELFYEDKDRRTVSGILLLTAIRISGIKPRRVIGNFYEVQWPC